ncbi:hypothetical protein C8Q77DRAFT_1156335 [Trametes polyzona]|nr:hypothetical protein C8Q77DRAFT_1156335 [Trametes polyzona]
MAANTLPEVVLARLPPRMRRTVLGNPTLLAEYVATAAASSPEPVPPPPTPASPEDAPEPVAVLYAAVPTITISVLERKIAQLEGEIQKTREMLDELIQFEASRAPQGSGVLPGKENDAVAEEGLKDGEDKPRLIIVLPPVKEKGGRKKTARGRARAPGSSAAQSAKANVLGGAAAAADKAASPKKRAAGGSTRGRGRGATGTRKRRGRAT